MTIPNAGAEFPSEDGVRYQRVDSLTVIVYIDGPGDTTVRPPRPETLKMIERDKEKIAEMNRRVQRDQDEINTRKRSESNPDVDVRPV